MRKDEIQGLLTLLQSEYPGSFAKMDDRQMALKLELWCKEFERDDSQIVYAAVRMLMWDGRDFAPSSGQIREKMQSLMESETLSEQQAWAMVSKACENGLYGYRREFEKLPPEVQRAVGQPEQLREWAAMDSSTVQSVVASNFMRNFRSTLQRQREMDRIPTEVKRLLSEESDRFAFKPVPEKRQIEAPTEAPRIEKIRLADVVKPVVAQKGEYKPPESGEWERMREEAMRRLEGGANG